MKRPVQGMPVYASDGEVLGQVARADEHGFVLSRRGGEVHVEERHLQRVDDRGVLLWLAKAELGVPRRRVRRELEPHVTEGVDEWGNRYVTPHRRPLVTAREYDEYKQTH